MVISEWTATWRRRNLRPIRCSSHICAQRQSLMYSNKSRITWSAITLDEFSSEAKAYRQIWSTSKDINRNRNKVPLDGYIHGLRRGTDSLLAYSKKLEGTYANTVIHSVHSASKTNTWLWMLSNDWRTQLTITVVVGLCWIWLILLQHSPLWCGVLKTMLCFSKINILTYTLLSYDYIL